MIVSSGKRLAFLVNDILDFAQLKNKSLTLRPTRVDLRAMTDVVFRLSEPLLASKNLRLLNRIPENLARVVADENRLEQIMHNLVGNAIKFTEQGHIRVCAEQNDSEIWVHVEDTGIGIPEDRYSNIFDSFEQADGTTGRTYGGTGLGLAVTRQLVQLHRGRIWVESRENKGSRFTFTLPVSDQPLTLTGTTTNQAPSSRPVPILTSDVTMNSLSSPQDKPGFPHHDRR